MNEPSRENLPVSRFAYLPDGRCVEAIDTVVADVQDASVEIDVYVLLDDAVHVSRVTIAVADMAPAEQAWAAEMLRRKQGDQ